MSITKTVRQHRDRVVYPVSYCPKTYEAMRSLQERLRDSSGIQYSISVIARSLGLLAVRDADTSADGELLALCRHCGSKGKKTETTKGGQPR